MKIDVQKSIVQILNMLLLYDRPMKYGEIFGNSSYDARTIRSSLVFLMRNDMVVIDTLGYMITESGYLWLEKICKNSNLDTDEFNFRFEVLTGCDNDGKKSKIEKAALHSNRFYRETNKIEDNQIFMIDKISKICEAENLTMQELEKKINDGTIRICNHKNNPHIGVFSKGQSICKKCKKLYR